MRHLSSQVTHAGQLVLERQAARRIAVLAFTVALVASIFPNPALANHGVGPDSLECGTVVTANYTLTHPVGPCAAGGLVVQASGTSTTPLVIDLGGFTLSGTAVPGDGAGILIDGESHVVVKNGTIRDFDGGVEIVGGGDNRIQNLLIEDNIGNEVSAYGEGVGIWDSSRNVVCNNVIHHNGPYAGVGVYETAGNSSDSNRIGDPACGTNPQGLADGGNAITENDIPVGNTNQDDGVRLEPGVTNNRVENNTVERNGLDGIAVFFAPAGNFTSSNVVKNNIVRFNGCHEYIETSPLDPDYRVGQPPAKDTCGAGTGLEWFQFTHRKGDGIRVFGPSATHNAVANVVEGNTVCGNAANGIRVDGGDKDGTNAANKNVISGNTSGDTTTGCALNDVVDDNGSLRLAYDLHDGNGNCTVNTWGSPTPNTTNGTRQPACIS